jgi:hypothetical protein
MQATATSCRSLVVPKATRTIYINTNTVDVKDVVLIEAYERKNGDLKQTTHLPRQGTRARAPLEQRARLK